MQPPPPNNIPPLVCTLKSTKRLLKQLLTLAAILLLTFIILCYIFIQRPFNQIAALHAKYLTITRPTTYAQVLQTMGPDPTVDETLDPGHNYTAYWDDDALPNHEEESEKITHLLRYSTATFFLPVTFEFTFDKDQNLIGKHRYD